MAVWWRKTVFQKMGCWNPCFYSVFFACALFWPSCQKREILDTHQKKKNLTHNWKALVLVFLCFFIFFFFLLFSFLLFYLLLFCVSFWRVGPPHLALNPPYFFGCFLVLFFLLFYIKCFFSPEKRVFWFIVEYLPLFLLSLFLACPFFNCSFSVSLFFFSFFLPSCLSFLLYFASLFLSLCLIFFLLCFVSWKEQHQNIRLQSFSSLIFSLFLVSCLVFSLKSLFLIFAFFLI